MSKKKVKQLLKKVKKIEKKNAVLMEWIESIANNIHDVKKRIG